MTEVEKTLPTSGDESIPRLALGQHSYNGLYVVGGRVLEECDAELRYPMNVKTYKEMQKDATISPALNVINMTISRVKWNIKIPEGYEKELLDKAKFLEQCMHDMDHTWTEFISRAASHAVYGHAPVEKVYRRRTKIKGSKYNDKLIGIAKLPLISQDSVDSWLWGEHGRTLTGLRQRTNVPTGYGQMPTYEDSFVEIPRKKFILFRTSTVKDDPTGESLLNTVYTAWRYKTEYERFEAMGVSKDLRGLKLLKLPAQYMSPDASDEEKAVYKYYQEGMRNLHANEQSSLIIPSNLDENGKPLFEFNLVSVSGQKAYDVDKIIQRYRKEVITGLLAPQLILGQDGGGSFSLASNLSDITSIVVETRLREIKDQLNHDLIPQLFALNGWSTEVTPYFDFGELSRPDLDVLSKFVQRVAAVGLMSNNAETVNWISEQAGMPAPFDDINLDIEEVREMLTNYESGAGEGMVEGSGNGTAKSSSKRDTSTSNSENA